MTNSDTETVFQTRLLEAFAEECFPCNPIPFATGLADLVRERGTDAIESDDAKKVLWVLMAQAYGQMAVIDMSDEWQRLYKTTQQLEN